MELKKKPSSVRLSLYWREDKHNKTAEPRLHGAVITLITYIRKCIHALHGLAAASDFLISSPLLRRHLSSLILFIPPPLTAIIFHV